MNNTSDNRLTAGDLLDIQGIIINGFGSLPYSRFLFFQFTDVEAGKAWLAEVAPKVRSAERKAKQDRDPYAVQLAFTYTGLTALQLPQTALDLFPREFSEGMSLGERPRVLGDTDASDPAKWQFGGTGKGSSPIHVIVMLYATDQQLLDSIHKTHEPGWTAGKLKLLYSQDSGRISDFEPFGYRDGVSQPAILGAPGDITPGETPINAGEFVLGYLNAYETRPLTPVIDGRYDPGNVLPPAIPSDSQEITSGQKDFGRNGTYLVFRKLAQDVDGLKRFIDENSKDADGNVDDYQRDLLGAKMVGRWKDGSPLVLAPDAPSKEFSEESKSNDFLYMDTDPQGLKCPIGAHIRRANPRDSQLPNPARSKVLSTRHRIIRRGRHYTDSRPEGEEHGLCFIALNADIQRQFEFIQQTWINSPKVNGLFDCKDPLVGDNDGTGHMEIPEEPVRRHMNGIPRFVSVRGGGYFFLPGIRALRWLAGLPALPALPGQASVPQDNSTTKGTRPLGILSEVWDGILSAAHYAEADIIALRELVDKKFESLLAKPGPTRALFGLLRQHDPILVLPGIAIVSRYDDVLEVLKNDAAFSVTEIYAKKMEATTGDFVLGMADTPQFQHELGLMQRAFQPGDLDQIRTWIRTWAEDLVEAASTLGKIDLVQRLSLITPAMLVETYFGTPGPDRPTLMRWMRVIFRDIFLNLENDSGMHQEAVKAGVDLNVVLNALIADRKKQIAAEPAKYDDFLSRLIKIQMEKPEDAPDDVIRRILGGTIVGTVDTNSKAIAQAIDVLLDRPDQLALAQAAAVKDDASFDAIIWESLRFNPQNPFLLRHTEFDTVVAAGTDREKTIKSGTLVIAGTMSAMFDDAKFTDASTFRTDRPYADYIHFGYGIHQCFGKLIGGIVIPETAKAILKKKALRRAEGRAGHIAYDGAFPNNLWLEFEAKS